MIRNTKLLNFRFFHLRSKYTCFASRRVECGYSIRLLSCKDQDPLCSVQLTGPRVSNIEAYSTMILYEYMGTPTSNPRNDMDDAVNVPIVHVFLTAFLSQPPRTLQVRTWGTRWGLFETFQVKDPLRVHDLIEGGELQSGRCDSPELAI